MLLWSNGVHRNAPVRPRLVTGVPGGNGRPNSGGGGRPACKDWRSRRPGGFGKLQEKLARALAQIINILDPGVIVLGGGLSNIEQLYDTVPKLRQERDFSTPW